MSAYEILMLLHTEGLLVVALLAYLNDRDRKPKK